MPMARPRLSSSSTSPFTDEQARKFCEPGQQVILGFKHPQYAHMVVMQEETRAALAGDFTE